MKLAISSLSIFLIWIESYAFVTIQQKYQEKYSLSSPYHTVTTHLRFLQPGNYHPSISAKTFDAEDLTEEQKIHIALKLKQIYDGTQNYIDPSRISKNPNFIDSVTHLQQYIPVDQFPGIYLIKKKNSWLYSRQSLDAILKIHKEIYPFGTDKLVEWIAYLNMGRSSSTYLGLYIWQYAAILVVTLLGFIGYKLISILIQRIVKQVLIRKGYQKIANEVLTPVARPLSMCLILILASFFTKIIQLPIHLSTYIFIGFNLFISLLIVIVCYRLIDILVYCLEIAAAKTISTLDDQLVPLVRKALKLFVIITGGIFILQNLDFDITGLLAGISIGGLAFALAAQDTIKNLFGSLMIFIDRPFQVGDWIIAQEIDGTVEEVGFRSTRVRTFHNSLVTIPNGNIANMTVDNMGMRVYRRFRTTIAITYDTPADLIEAFIEGLKKTVMDHPKTRKDYYEIHLNAFGSSSLDILFYIFFEQIIGRENS